MRFFINMTSEEEISGWLCPDDFNAQTRVNVVLEGSAVVEVDCTIPYPQLKEWGWHRTGECGFSVNEATVPGYGAAERIEVFDPGSNVLLHRRLRPPSHVDRKLLLFNTGAEPEVALQQALFGCFQACYFDAGNLPDETLRTVLSNAKWTTSLFVSGSMLVPRYEDLCAHSSIDAAILIRDPFEVLAGRLHRIRRQAETLATPGQEWRVADLRTSIAFLEGLDLTDRRGIRRMLRDMPEETFRLLADPLTRLLGTKQPGDPVGPDNASVAIEILSRMDLVGHVAHYDAFLETLFDRLGIAPLPVAHEVPPDAVLATAEALRAGGAGDLMIANDLRLSEAVAAIIAKQWAA